MDAKMNMANTDNATNMDTTSTTKHATKLESWAVSFQADHEQYWQGHGISFTHYTHCATGCGETLREAFEDAMEDLAQQGIYVPVFDGDAMLDELRSQVRADIVNPLTMTIVEAECDSNGKHTTTVTCATCDGEGNDNGGSDCATCDGKGEYEGEDENPDCAVCAGNWHFYVNVDVKIAESAEATE
jgi:DnaJ-class molecular chaperone